jgi:hypothetical protein
MKYEADGASVVGLQSTGNEPTAVAKIPKKRQVIIRYSTWQANMSESKIITFQGQYAEHRYYS